MSDQTLQQEKDVISLKTDTGVNLETSPDENGDPDLVECTRFLRQLCPACFGGSSFGRPLEEYAFFSDFHLLGYICLTAFSAVAIFIFAPMETSTIDTWFPGDPAFLFMTQSTSYQNPSSMRLENTSPALESYPPNIENPVSQTRQSTSARTPMKLPMETRRRLPLVRLAMTTVVGCRWCAATTFRYFSPILIRQESSINLL